MGRFLWSMGAIIVLGVVGYLDLVADVMAPKSKQTLSVLVGSNYGMSLRPYNEAMAAATAKYGAAAETTFEADSGKIETIVNGTVVARSVTPRRFVSAVGVLYVGQDNARSAFPFRIGPTELPKPADFPALLSHLKDRYRGKVPQSHLAFSDSQVSLESCRTYSASQLGLSALGSLLRIGSSSACVVTFSGRRTARMLIGVTVADAGSWLRPFTQRLCRSLSESWLAAVRADGVQTPNYVACLIADRPERRDTPDILSEHGFEVQASSTLAVLRSPQ